MFLVLSLSFGIGYWLRKHRHAWPTAIVLGMFLGIFLGCAFSGRIVDIFAPQKDELTKEQVLTPFKGVLANQPIDYYVVKITRNGSTIYYYNLDGFIKESDRPPKQTDKIKNGVRCRYFSQFSPKGWWLLINLPGETKTEVIIPAGSMITINL